MFNRWKFIIVTFEIYVSARGGISIFLKKYIVEHLFSIVNKGFKFPYT